MSYLPPSNYSGYQQPFLQRNPGESLGIAAFVCSLIIWPAGFILALIARSQSRAAGFPQTGLNKAALIISSIFLGLTLLAILFGLMGLLTFNHWDPTTAVWNL